MDIYTVDITSGAYKSLKKIPEYVVVKLQSWIDDVGELGLREVRKIKSFHDEPLKGHRFGQRSIRLSKAYRAIYEIDKRSMIHIVKIVEVNKHEY